jgi:hypothetical protein
MTRIGPDAHADSQTSVSKRQKTVPFFHWKIYLMPLCSMAFFGESESSNDCVNGLYCFLICDSASSTRRPDSCQTFGVNSSIARAYRAEFFAAGGEMGRRMRDFEWSRTPLGPPASWPQSLRTAVQIMLGSRYAMWMGWGPKLTFFYNDAYVPTLGTTHRWALGKPSRKVWREIFGTTSVLESKKL